MSALTYKVECELNAQPMYLALDRTEAKRLMTAFLQILSPVQRMERTKLVQALIDADIATPAQAMAMLNSLKSRALSLGFAIGLGSRTKASTTTSCPRAARTSPNSKG